MSGRRPASSPSPGPGRIGDLVLSWDTHTHQWTVGRLHGLADPSDRHPRSPRAGGYLESRADRADPAPHMSTARVS